MSIEQNTKIILLFDAFYIQIYRNDNDIEFSAVLKYVLAVSVIVLFSPNRESVPKFIGPQFSLGQIIKVPQTWVIKPEERLVGFVCVGVCWSWWLVSF